MHGPLLLSTRTLAFLIRAAIALASRTDGIRRSLSPATRKRRSLNLTESIFQVQLGDQSQPARIAFLLACQYCREKPAPVLRSRTINI